VYVIWHYYGCVEIVAFAVVVQAVLEYGVSGLRSESDAIAFAECDEYCPSCFLIVREHAVVFVFSVEGLLRHGNVKIKSKVKSVGQECPTHTGISDTSFAVAFGFVCDG
jgi:hypothetical protein